MILLCYVQNERIKRTMRNNLFISYNISKFLGLLLNRLLTLTDSIRFLCIHADHTSKTISTKHVVEGLVDFRKGDFMGDEFLQFKLLLIFQTTTKENIVKYIRLIKESQKLS